jgi:hypothetical protein
MERKVLCISLVAAILLVLLPISSVVGTMSTTTTKNVSSPLFYIRTHQSLHSFEQPLFTTNFLGKGNDFGMIYMRKIFQEHTIRNTIKFLGSRPDLLSSLLNQIEQQPALRHVLGEHSLSVEEIRQQLNLVYDDPSILQEMVGDYDLGIPLGDAPRPLGLSTSNPLACFIALIALIPVGLILTMLIATITIFTCLNINGCFESMYESIMEGIIQGLHLPEY